MKKLKYWLLAMKIFYFSLRIRKNRKRMSRLIKQGGPYISSKLIRLDDATVQMGYRTHQLFEIWVCIPKASIHPFPMNQEEEVVVEQEERSA